MKKALVIIIGLLCVCMLAFAGCKTADNTSASDNVNNSSATAAKTLTKIELTTAPTKTAYEIGETIDTTGMKVTATFSDGTTADVTADCTTSMGANPVTASTTATGTAKSRRGRELPSLGTMKPIIFPGGVRS